MKKFNKVALQRQLDVTAESLEKEGHADLADLVDFYAARLMKATAEEIPLINRAIGRIRDQYNTRLAKDAVKETSKEKEDPKEKKEEAAEAEAPVQTAKQAQDERKALLRKRLAALAQQRERVAGRLAALKAAKQAQKEPSKEDRRTSRKERLSVPENK